MADFVELPVQGGFGPYHFNRYRIVFDKPEAVSQESLAADLVNRFAFHFNSDFATVKAQTRTFGGRPTLKFHGCDKVCGIDIARPHHDWVVQDPIDIRSGFTARTLRRQFIDLPDDAEAGIPAGILGGAPSAAEAVSVNQMHFLAGRRCWLLDTAEAFGLPGDQLVLETTAVERFSRPEYVMADTMLGMEKLVPDIWCSLLWNFVVHKNVHAHRLPLKGGWAYGNVGYGMVQYLVRPKPSLTDLLSDPEFKDAYGRFGTVIDLSVG